MEKLLPILEESSEFQRILQFMKQKPGKQYVTGPFGSQKAFFYAGIRKMTGQPQLIITADSMQAHKVMSALAEFLPEHERIMYPGYEVMGFDILAQSREVLSQRLSVLNGLARGDNLIIIATARSLMTRLVPVKVFNDAQLVIDLGDQYPLDQVLAELVNMGYERSDMVEGKGQFSLRGGILDIFPDGEANPVRIEFFGDAVDSIRSFDSISQRSIQNMDSVLVTPASELILDDEVRTRGIQKMEEEMAHQIRRIREVRQKNELRAKICSLIEKVTAGIELDRASAFLPYFYPESATLLDYLPKDTMVMIDEPARVREASEGAEQILQETYRIALENGRALPGQWGAYVPYAEWMKTLDAYHAWLWSSLLRQIPGAAPDELLSISSRPLYPFQGNIETITNELKVFQKNHYRVIIGVHTLERARNLSLILKDQGFLVREEPVLMGVPQQGHMVVTVSQLDQGYELPELGLAVVTEGEVLFTGKRQRRPKKKPPTSSLHWKDLAVGEYVVHINHGIGRFLGMKTMQVDQIQKDYLQIQYHGEDRLYVSVEQMGLVQRYVGPQGQEPRLNRLGGGEWTKAKNVVKAAVADMADKLLALYAHRESIPGFSFSKDTVWQNEFEDKFPYEETDDQLRTVEEVKQDMESQRPMDRLLCGDVGYGKTEVAIRAAFKAVMDGKQVGVLVPTTVLAQQHFHTFSSRFAGYPIRIAMLSRFVSPKDTQMTLKGLSNGTVDIVIGTHRILQDDIHFSDLGLLIVDEEQRFGVVHKERLKELRQQVDVLTLTATPIPRTLHMALSGIRDMSTITEPPEDRLPVQTFVLEYDEVLLKDAIIRELDRGGQVYFIHNTVRSIERVAQRLRELIPDAAIAVGHGQMKEDRLEKTMIDFIQGDYDILVCTTIVETGLDIPNVNTIIVDHADRFGLSQLYQLRGRVGRSNRQGYAYFLFKKDKVLTEIAEKRLQAIREFTEFGSGFKISMRDLEIRGAGNLLGSEQSGHLSAVGFELYCQLLDEAVQEARGTPVKVNQEPVIDLRVDAFLTDSYISDSRQKIDIYKKIATCQNESDIQDILDEIGDRFGDIPDTVFHLIEIVRLKLLAKDAKIIAMVQEKERVVLKLSRMSHYNQECAGNVIRHYRKRITLMASTPPQIFISVGDLKQTEMLALLKEFLVKFNTCLER
jgi:transcription-repair coupling factor (superfamily II helicase)